MGLDKKTLSHPGSLQNALGQMGGGPGCALGGQRSYESLGGASHPPTLSGRSKLLVERQPKKQDWEGLGSGGALPLPMDYSHAGRPRCGVL